MRSVKANTATVNEDRERPSTGSEAGEYLVVFLLLLKEPELGFQFTLVVIQ